jgi:hypothetical protein
MGYSKIVRGHVDSIARAINVLNAQPNHQGVATVNPIFTWVRLAQRIPVRIHIDEVPPGIVLAAGMTATAEVDARARASVQWTQQQRQLSIWIKKGHCQTVADARCEHRHSCVLSTGSAMVVNCIDDRRIVQEFSSRFITRVLSTEERLLQGYLDGAIDWLHRPIGVDRFQFDEPVLAILGDQEGAWAYPVRVEHKANFAMWIFCYALKNLHSGTAPSTTFHYCSQRFAQTRDG